MEIERRNAERKRRTSDHMFQTMFKAMDEGAILLNKGGEVVAVNPAAENILGMSATELIGRSTAEYVQALNCITEDATPLSPELHPALLALQTGKPQSNALLGVHRPDGTLVWLSINAQPMVSDGEAGLHGVVTTFRDVTERKRTEDALSFVAQRGWVDRNENFFDALVQYLGKTLGVDYVLVSRLTEAPGIVETVALYAKGAIVPNLRYGLKGAPCENVMGNKFCFYPQGIQQTFPEDALLVEMEACGYAGLPLWDSTGQPIGLIAVLDGKPLRDETHVSQILQFMATRAAAELERKRNDRMLRRSEREFRSLAENMPDNVIRYDRQTRVQYVNPTMMTRIAAEFLPVLGESVTQTYPGNEGAAWCERVVEQVVATGTPAEVEFEMANPQGELRLNHVRFVAERDEHGEIVGALGIGRDITEQRASERQLRQALEFTQGVINAIPDLLFEADRNGTCLNVWARTPELLAVHKENLLGKRVSDVVAPDTAEVALAALREADEKGLSFGKVLRVDIPQGERWFELSVSKKPGGDMPGRFIVLSRDVTGRKRMEDDIRRRELEFRILAENIPDIVVRHDRQARVRYVNPALLASVPPEFSVVLGESLVETFPGNAAKADLHRLIMRVIETGAPAEVEFQLPNPCGEMRIHEVRYVAEHDSNGEIIGVLGIGRDITERKRMEEDIRRRELEFRSLAENMPDNVVRYDQQARVVYMNPAIMANVAPHFRPVLGQSPMETYPGKESATGHQRMVEQVIATGMPAEWEFQTLDSCGEIRIHHARYVAERDNNGEIVGVLGLGRDITERKLAEEYEQFRSRTLELVSGGAPLPVILEGIVRGVEQLKPDMICSILLLDKQGKKFGEGIAPSLPDFYNAAVDGLQIGIGVGSCGTAAATGERVIADDIMTHPYWAPYKEIAAKAGLASCWSEPIRASTGKVLGTFAVYHRQAHSPAAFDISLIEKSTQLVSIAIERRRTEEALRASELEFRSLAENMPDNVVRYDRQARAQYFNPAMKASLAPGFLPVLGESPIETHLGNDGAESYQRAIEQVIATGTPVELEFQAHDPRGEIRDHLVRFVAERDDNGKIVGALAIGQDITERKRAEMYEQFRSRTLELLSGGAPLQDVLEGIVRGVEQLKPDMICSIVLLDSQSKRFCKVIGPSLPDSYNAGLDGLEIGIGVGSCGTAAATGERVIVEDIQTHPYWAPYKEIAAGAGLAACWSEPVRASTGKVLGTFAAYHRQAHSPAPFDIALIEKSTHLVSIAIERRRAEEALRASEREFRTLAENLPDPLVRYDRMGHRTYVSPVLERAFAVTAESMVGVKARETNPTAMPMRETYLRALEHTLATGERSEFEMQMASPDGNMLTHQCFMVAERALDGQISGAIAVSRDITEQKRTEVRLALQARRAEVLLELPSASEAMDEVAFMQRGQELAEELTGSSISFIHFVNEGEDSIDLVTWSRRTLEHYCLASFNKHYPISEAGIWADALRQRRPVVFNDYAAYSHKRGLPEGHAELTRLISLPVIENGKVVMLAGVGNKPADYTDLDVETVQLIANEIWRIVQRKRTDKQLEEHRCHLERLVESRTQALSIAKETAEAATQAKSRFLAAASHDLRQPICAIGLFNDALALSGLNEAQKRMSSDLTRSVASLTEMLNELLDMAKLDAGKLVPQPAVIQSGELLGTLASEFDSVAREKHLRFNLYCPRRNLALFTDKNLLLTILRNLIGNAVKYTKQGGILVSIRQRDNCALIQVWDTGIGIAPEQLDLIFEEYFQAGNAERNRAKGAGLGLAIVKRVSEALGNCVSCRSRLGRGSVFEISLPLAQVSGEQIMPTQTSATGMIGAFDRFAGKRIVVIEDDVLAATALKSLLETHGMHVTHFGTAEDALGSTEAMEADHYISDYHLPGMNGIQLLHAIQTKSAEPIKAVVLTGNTSLEQIATSQSPSWKVLFKPVALPELFSAMEL